MPQRDPAQQVLRISLPENWGAEYLFCLKPSGIKLEIPGGGQVVGI